ncbi:MAG TPA: SEC-C metal-binding domain-containing protein, partial [Patescibacteria group bacterium]|nr:SEC-C metal-binding domain-containing protein [Patescibacteria group bacterium]
QFFVSLEDELMRRFGGDKLKNIMDRFGLPEDQPIENKIISRTIENAQSKIEGFNFDIRKHVLEYDDVMNKQREVIYKKRREILETEDVKNEILEYIKDEIEKIVSINCSAETEKCDAEKIMEEARQMMPIDRANITKIQEIDNNKSKSSAEKVGAISEFIFGIAKEIYGKKEVEVTSETLRRIEKSIILETYDTVWMNHLDEIDYLREGIGLRGYGQRDPLVEYKREAFSMFTHLMENIKSAIAHTVFRIHLIPQQEERQTRQQNLNYSGGEEVGQFSSAKKAQSDSKEEIKPSPIINNNTVGRNDPCPCGSGKKYKKCCGK